MSFLELNELKVEKDTSKKKRIEKAKKDFWFFCLHYLDEFFTEAPAPYQRTLIDIINKERVEETHIKALRKEIHSKYHKLLYPIKKLKGIVDVEPREHGKSTRMSFAYPLWRILTGRSKFVVIIASSQKLANKILRDIKYELIGNEKILEDFGQQRGEVWTADFIELKNGSAVMASGAGSAIRGTRHRQHRPDLIICDDILKDETARSPTQREKIYDWFKRAVIPLGKDAIIIVVNTIFHHDDLPSRLLKEIQQKTLKNWLGLRFSAIKEDNTPLWPSHWPLQDLEEKKLVLGSSKFATEYMNEPTSDEEAIFRPEWIKYYTDAQLPPRDRLIITMGVDPATGKQHGDYSAYVVVGKDKETGKIYVLEAYGKKVSPERFTQDIISAYKRWAPKVIIFEEIAFQEIYKKVIMEKASKEGIHMPIKGIKHRLSKAERIYRLAPLVENGFILFRENQTLLVDQLLTFPKSDHDDLPDALEMAIQGLEKTQTKPMPLKVDLISKYLARLWNE